MRNLLVGYGLVHLAAFCYAKATDAMARSLYNPVGWETGRYRS